MKHLAIFLFLAIALALSLPKVANGQCTPIYGGGQTCVSGNLVIDKKVANPQTGAMVDNLFENDPKYGPDQLVTFQLRITNTGNSALTNVVVKDILPPHVRFESGPGAYTDATRTLTFTIQTLNAGETQTFTITARTVSADNLSKNRVCGDPDMVINQGIAAVNNVAVQDNAKFCIEKPAAVGGPVVVTQPTGVPGKGQPTVTKGGLKVFPAPLVTKTPPTGPEMLALAALLPTGLLGQFLRKRSVK